MLLIVVRVVNAAKPLEEFPGEGSKIMITTTPGAYSKCCGVKDCKKQSGTRNLQMAQAVQEGVKAVCPNCQADIVDISAEDKDCPTVDDIKAYDAIIVGTPTWTNMPSPDVTSWMGGWRPYKSFPCRIGAAFSTGSDIYAGIQPTIEVLHTYMKAYQMIIVGNAKKGLAGEFLEGAAADVANGGPWPTGQYGYRAKSNKTSNQKYGGYAYNAGGPNPAKDASHVVGELEEAPVDAMFLDDAKALGARVANVSTFLKGVPEVCGQMVGSEMTIKW